MCWSMTSGPGSRMCPSARSRSPSLSISTKCPPSQPQYWEPSGGWAWSTGLAARVVPVDGKRPVAVVHHEVFLDVGAASAPHPQVHVPVVVDVARRGRLDMQVRGVRRGHRRRPLLVLLAHRVGQRRRVFELPARRAEQQLRRVAVPAALRPDVDAGVVRDRDRSASPDRREQLRRRQLEPPVTGPEEHLHRQACPTGLRPSRSRRSAGRPRLCRPGRPLQVRYGDDDLDPVEAAWRADALERLRIGGGQAAGGRAARRVPAASRSPAPDQHPPSRIGAQSGVVGGIESQSQYQPPEQPHGYEAGSILLGSTEGVNEMRLSAGPCCRLNGISVHKLSRRCHGPYGA